MSVECLYFDLAGRTGYAAGGARTGVETFGFFEIPKTNDDIGAYLNHADRCIEKLVVRLAPSILAFEAPWINPRRDTIISLRKLSGLANVAEQVASRHQIECMEAEVHDVSLHFLGRGYPRESESKKRATRVKCRDLGYQVDGSDEADALAGLSYVIACRHPEVALETCPLFRRSA